MYVFLPLTHMRTYTFLQCSYPKFSANIGILVLIYKYLRYTMIISKPSNVNFKVPPTVDECSMLHSLLNGIMLSVANFWQNIALGST